MPYVVSGYPESSTVPMTEVFSVTLDQSYDWDEGRLFRHDETGFYAFIADSGCSCYGYLERFETRVELSNFMAAQDWTPLEHQLMRIIAYIESDKGRYDANGPEWVVTEKARLATFLQAHRR